MDLFDKKNGFYEDKLLEMDFQRERKTLFSIKDGINENIPY